MNGRMIRTPRSLGKESLTRLAVSTALLTLTACGGGSQEADENLSALQSIPESAAAQNGELSAETDVAEITAGNTVVVSILSNDSLAPDASLQLVGSPANGSAKLLPSGEVEYTPDDGFEGTDIVEYRLVDAQGNESAGKLYIAVVCAECNAPDPSTLDPGGLPYCFGDNADPDGDGYGWENNASCAVPEAGAALSPLAAKADSAELARGEVITLMPLRNDSIADRDNVRMNIETEPGHGSIEAVEAGIIVYAAPDDYYGADSLIYSITDVDGNTSVASIDFNITCDSCIDYKGVRLTWPANPEDEGVEGYKVLFGADENPLTSTQISDVKVTDGGTPEVVFDLIEDLSLADSEGGCFMIQAYRGGEISEASEAACFTRGS